MLPVIFVSASLIGFGLHLLLGREPRYKKQNRPTPPFVSARDKHRSWQSIGMVRTHLHGR